MKREAKLNSEANSITMFDNTEQREQVLFFLRKVVLKFIVKFDIILLPSSDDVFWRIFTSAYDVYLHI